MKQRYWKANPEALLRAIRELIRDFFGGRVPTWNEAKARDYGIVMAAYKLFGGWRLALKAAGYPEYPEEGHERWRTKTTRRMRKEEVVAEIESSQNPSRMAVLAFLKEKGFHRDPSIRRALNKATGSFTKEVPCSRCGVPVLSPKKYCGPCRRVVIREQTRKRQEKFFSDPANAARYAEKRREYQRRKYEEEKASLSPDQLEARRAQARQYYREYYTRKRAENPELFRAREKLKYWRKKVEKIKKETQNP
jgi:hypothetical protein